MTRAAVLIAFVVALLGACKEEKEGPSGAGAGQGGAAGERAEPAEAPAWAADTGEGSGWFCYEFMYDGKPRTHCAEGQEACNASRASVSEIGSDLGPCAAAAEVHCFYTHADDLVCSPTAEACETTRKERARMSRTLLAEYTACSLGVGEPPAARGRAATGVSIESSAGDAGAAVE